MSIDHAVSFPKTTDHRLTKVALGFILLLTATVLATATSDANVAPLTVNQIAEQL